MSGTFFNDVWRLTGGHIQSGELLPGGTGGGEKEKGADPVSRLTDALAGSIGDTLERIGVDTRSLGPEFEGLPDKALEAMITMLKAVADLRAATASLATARTALDQQPRGSLQEMMAGPVVAAHRDVILRLVEAQQALNAAFGGLSRVRDAFPDGRVDKILGNLAPEILEWIDSPPQFLPTRF